MGETIDRAWLAVRVWAGSCAPVAGVEDIKAALDQGEQALIAPHLLAVVSNSKVNVGDIREGLGKIKEGIELVENVCLDAKAIRDIHAAIEVLSDDNVMFTDKAAAAKAFDKLFTGVGRLARHLPSPAKEWGEFFENCGNFFSNFQQMSQNRYDRIFRASYAR